METQAEKKGGQSFYAGGTWARHSNRRPRFAGQLAFFEQGTRFFSSAEVAPVMSSGIEEFQFTSQAGLVYTADYQTHLVIERLLDIYFRANSNLLEAVYLTEMASNEMHYSIVLKNDTDENRATIFSILDDPQILSLESEYPIYFQFYPQRLKDRIAGRPVVF